ncbi:hypothetical protein NPX13_g8344 [Xylaria arbuscula]|uniref:Uncharacterized protein n=1 Tax=Xylaria arbuscula TaxID=114810 RepID=A0A9W8TIF7_9PEZI|nr:hypothetical protein NPX13_g8344 [Xylaria arbuscula]
MVASTPSLPHSKGEYNEGLGETSRPPYHPHVGIAQNTATPQRLATVETNMKESDKTPHKDLADIGFSGYRDSHGQDEFPPIETLWAQILERKKQSQPPSASPTVMNSPTRYQEYLQREAHPAASDPMHTISPQSGSGAGARRQTGRKETKDKHRQAPRRSERIKALKKKNTKNRKLC